MPRDQAVMPIRAAIMRTAKVMVQRRTMNAKMVNTTSDMPVSADLKLVRVSDLGFNMRAL